MSLQTQSKIELHCPHFEHCPGCTELDLLKSHKQKESWVIKCFQEANLKTPRPEWIFEPRSQLRERFDFQFRSPQQFGLLGKNKELIPIQQCLQLTPSLQNAFEKLQLFQFPFEKASLRLRVSPHVSKPGLWIDAANVDIKKLLQQPDLMEKLTDSFFVEMGQKGKEPALKSPVKGSVWGLNNRVLRPWTSTWINPSLMDENLSAANSEEALIEWPLDCAISDFTQPSRISNYALIKKTLELQKQIQRIGATKNQWTELGAGIGNFTVALAKNNTVANDTIKNNNITVFALENNSESLHSLTQNLRNDSQLMTQIDFRSLDYHGKKDFELTQAVLANPSRSGLGVKTSQKIASTAKHLVYISCHLESMIRDIKEMPQLKIEALYLCDQFAGSDHIEVIAYLKE